MHANEDIFYIRKAQRWFSPYFYLILSDWRFLRKRPWIPVVDKVHWRINEFLVFLPLSVLFPYPRRNPAFFFFSFLLCCAGHRVDQKAYCLKHTHVYTHTRFTRSAMNSKKYIGRQLRPSQLAAELLPPDQKWCTVCHQAVEKKRFGEHAQTSGHRLGQKKLNKLRYLSLSMWEKHRGAPLDQESGHEGTIQEEFARYQADQQRREQLSVQEAWNPPHPNRHRSLF